MPSSAASTLATSVFLYSGGAYKEQACQRFVFVQQSGFGHLHSFHHLTDGFFLPVDAGADAFVQAFQVAASSSFMARALTLQVRASMSVISALSTVCSPESVGMYFPVSSCFVHQVDGFVGQETVADVAGACLYGVGDDVGLVGYAVVGFVFLFQAFYDMYGFFNAGSSVCLSAGSGVPVPCCVRSSGCTRRRW